ncbi:hypothetical protein K438DRAFT_1878941, partial [Mycena galopus ATCC 62051]
MSPQPTIQARLNNIIACLPAAVETLQILADSINTPFLTPISSTARSLLNVVQTVKKNKSDCAQLMELTCKLLYAIISLHMKSETGLDLSPTMLNHLGKITETLHKIHTFVEAQQGKSKIRHFFRQCKGNLSSARERGRLAGESEATQLTVLNTGF